MLKRKEIFGIVLIVLFFVASAFLSNKYKVELQSSMEGYAMMGMVSYMLIVILSEVIAPINALPLLPLAVALWGPFVGAILSIFAWLIGSIIVYWILQKYGRSFVSKFINLKKFDDKHINIPKKNKFWILVGLRMIMPVDILSYLLGLFVPMSYQLYITTTAIGIIPGAFLYAYASKIFY